jgi:hypothetical protein
MNKNCRAVVFIENGIIQDIIMDSKRNIEFLVVDMNPETLDQSFKAVMGSVMSGPFQDYAALAEMYGWEAFFDPERVREIFAERKSQLGFTNKAVVA